MEDIKYTLLAALAGIMLILTTIFWSTVQFIFLLLIGVILTAWGMGLRDERKSYALVPSVLGFVVSFVIVLNYTPILISQMGQEDAPAVEIIEEAEEDQGILDKIFGGESEPEEPEEPSLLDQNLGWVIIANAVSMILSIGTFASRKKTGQQISKDSGVENSSLNQSSITSQTHGQKRNSGFHNFFVKFFHHNE
jgi:uncharacterized membrane protein